MRVRVEHETRSMRANSEVGSQTQLQRQEQVRNDNMELCW